ncbi:HIT family protein [Streptomyces luteogriseus]|jgi:diadenosine tetraphosphate (Ap4A) HIT family hydrolase|uniref:HIT family protein n=1 Tax=Streptomyces luteogriseus TaxID=68233 RepID=UPI003798EDC9
MPDCDLCQAVSPTVGECALQDHLRPGQQRIVATSKYASAIPTIGAFVPGYLLIVPDRHVLSLGLLPDNELTDLEEFARHEAERLHHVYRQPVLAFEYGLNVPDGRRVGHGHLHLLPTNADLAEWLARRLPGHKIDSLTQLPRADDTSYIAVQDWTGTTVCHPVPNDATPRLRLREIVARLDRRVPDDVWDWQSHPFPERMRVTVDDLTSAPSIARPCGASVYYEHSSQPSAAPWQAARAGRP